MGNPDIQRRNMLDGADAVDTFLYRLSHNPHPMAALYGDIALPQFVLIGIQGILAQMADDLSQGLSVRSPCLLHMLRISPVLPEKNLSAALHQNGRSADAQPNLTDLLRPPLGRPEIHPV